VTGQLLAAPAAHRRRHSRVRKAHEVAKRARLAVLVAHEQHRGVGRGDHQRDGGTHAIGVGQGRDALTLGAVADLVVVLQTAHQPPSGKAAQRRAHRAPARGRETLAAIHEAAAVGGGDVGQPPEVGVVRVGLVGQRHVQRVVQLVGPHRVHAVAAGRARGEHTGVVAIALSDQRGRIAAPDGGVIGGVAQLRENVARRGVHQGVNRVQAQAVHAERAEPPRHVVGQQRPHRVAAGPVEVEPLAPMAGRAVGEVRSELGQVVARRPQVVVHHVQHHGQAGVMGRLDEAPHCVGPAVGRVGGEPQHAVVAPAELGVEGVDRHELDVGHAQLGQSRQVDGGGVEGALGSERADVQLVDDGSLQRGRVPSGGAWRHPGRIDQLRQRVDAVGLSPRCRIGPQRAAVEAEPVAAAVGR
jgi:hypothetical protein